MDEFVLIPESAWDKWDDNSPLLKINKRRYDKNIIVSPCGSEHWISTDLFKFRIHAEKLHRHVIGVCPLNQIPFYSLFCDEIAIVEANPEWYSQSTNNGSKVIRSQKDHMDIEVGDFRHEFTTAVSDDEVIARFAYKKIYFLESVYNKFLSIKEELPTDLIVMECKQERISTAFPELEKNLPAVGLNYSFQKKLLLKTGKDCYMSFQILASNFLNWQYFCYGGSSNLMCVLPMRLLSMKDRTVNQSVANVVRGFSTIKGYPGIPAINSVKRCSQIKEDFKILTDCYVVPAFTNFDK